MALQAGELYATLDLDSEAFNNGMDDAIRRTSRDIPNANDVAGRSFSGLQGIANGVMMAIGSAIVKVVQKIAEIGVEAVKTGISFNAMKEQSEIAWTTLLGSAEEARAMIQRIQDLGAYTPFQFEGLDKAAKMLNMAKYEGDDLERTLVAVGDAVSAVGAGEEGLQAVSNAIYKISAKGKASAEEINMLAERGIPAWDMIAEAMGVGTSEIIDMCSAGQLMADEVLPILVDQMENRFGGAMDKQSTSFSGLISTMQDNWEVLMGNMTKGLFDMAKSALPVVINAMDKLNAMFSDGTMARYFGIAKDIIVEIAQIMMPVFTPLLGLLNSVGKQVRDTFSGLDGSVFTGLVDGAKNMLTGISTAFSGITTFFADMTSGMINLWTQFVGSLLADGTLSNFMTNVGNLFSTLITIVGPILENIKNLVVNTFGQFLELVRPLITDVVNFIGEACTMMQEFWAEYGDRIMAVVNVAFTTIQTVITVVMTVIMTIVSSVWNNIKGIFTGALEAIGGIIDIFTGLFTGNWSLLWEGIKSLVSGALEFIWNLINLVCNVKILGSIKSFITGSISAFSGWVSSVVNWFKNLGTNCTTLIDNLVNGVINLFKSFYTNTGNIVTNIKNMVVQTFQYMGMYLKEIISNIVNWFVSGFNGIKDNISNITGAIGDMAIKIKDKVLGIAKDALSWGKDIVRGIANGITGAISLVTDAIKGIANAISGKFKSLLGIASPSKLFTQYGKWTSEGLAIGINDNLRMIEDSASNMAMAIQPEFADIEAPMPTVGISDAMAQANIQSKTSPLSLNIANFNNNRNIDIEILAEELQYYINRKSLAMGVK